MEEKNIIENHYKKGFFVKIEPIDVLFACKITTPENFDNPPQEYMIEIDGHNVNIYFENKKINSIFVKRQESTRMISFLIARELMPENISGKLFAVVRDDSIEEATIENFIRGYDDDLKIKEKKMLDRFLDDVGNPQVEMDEPLDYLIQIANEE